jgi:4-alpha-glucanotransferase
MQLQETKEAYELLNWMNKVHTRDLDPRYLKTVQHLDHVIGLFRIWTWKNNAEPLIHYLLQGQDSLSESLVADLFPNAQLRACRIGFNSKFYCS